MFFTKKFGLKQALQVLADTPDLTNREAKVGVSFVEASGVKVTLITEINEKITALGNFFNNVKEGIKSAIASLDTIAEDGRQDVNRLQVNVTATVRTISQNAETAVDKIATKADRKIEKFEDKIQNTQGLKNFKTNIVLGKASDKREALEGKAKAQIEDVENTTTSDLEDTRTSIADLQSQVDELQNNIGEIEKLGKIFIGTTDATKA